MRVEIYFAIGFLLLLFAYIVFRVIARRDYRDRQKLRAVASSLQFLVFAGFFTFPYLFNPAEWPWFWRQSSLASQAWYLIGLAFISGGFIVAFGTMAWFGIGKAFGVKMEGLTRTGPYARSRNPQILGGYLMVIGVVMQWPSLYAIGWLLIYVLMTRWMIMTEEEHLSRVFGEDYRKYRAEVPRYLFGAKQHKEASA